MAKESTLADLVETIIDASAALEKWHAQKDGARSLNAARRLASASATIVSRLKGFSDVELAGWVAAVDRAHAQREESNHEV